MQEKHYKSSVKGKLVQFSVVYTHTYTLAVIPQCQYCGDQKDVNWQ